MALNTASTGPLPPSWPCARAVDGRSSRSAVLRPHRAADDRSETNLMWSLFARHLVVDQGDDVLVEDVLLLVGQVLEALERVVQLALSPSS